MAGRTTIICGFQTNFHTLFMAGRTTIICGFQTIFRLCLWQEEQPLFVDSKPFFATEYGGKNYDYFRISNHFPLMFMAGRTTIISGFQTNFRTLFIAGRTMIICGFQTNFRTLFMAGRTTIICGFQTNFCLCL
jgi:hypothetical protein